MSPHRAPQAWQDPGTLCFPVPTTTLFLMRLQPPAFDFRPPLQVSMIELVQLWTTELSSIVQPRLFQ